MYTRGQSRSERLRVKDLLTSKPYSQGSRVISRANTSWCKCGETGLIVGIEFVATTQAPEYWILFQDGGYALWPHSLVEETIAVSSYIDRRAKNNLLTDEADLQALRIAGAFRF